MILLFQLGVFPELLRDLDNPLLQLLSGVFTVPDELLILNDVLLQVVENLEFLIESDERVEFVLKFNLFLLESQLELVFISLVEHLRRKRASRDCARDRSGG